MRHLIDNSKPDRPLIEALVHRDPPFGVVFETETAWAMTRKSLAGSGLYSAEHRDWDWSGKADSVKAGDHLLVVIEVHGEGQGLMAVKRVPAQARLFPGLLTYVDYVESAPWNLRTGGVEPRYLGVGTL